MKATQKTRLLAFCLAVCLLIGGLPMLAVTAGDEPAATVEQWTGDRLVAAKQAGAPFTTDVVGVREPASSSRGDWYWIMWIQPTSQRPDGSLIFTAGAHVEAVCRYGTDDSYTGGNLDFLDATGCGGNSAWVTQDLWEAAPTLTDPVLGYTCREVTVDMGEMARDVNQLVMHIGTPSTGGRHTVEMYALSIRVDGETVWSIEGERLAQAAKGNIVREEIANTSGQPTGLVVERAATSAGEVRTLAEMASQPLAAGRYEWEVEWQTVGDGSANDCARASVTGQAGLLGETVYTAAERRARLLGDDTGRYDVVRVPFTVTGDDVDQAVTLRLDATDGAELRVRRVALVPVETGAAYAAAQAIEAIPDFGPYNMNEARRAIEAAEAALRVLIDAQGEDAAAQVTGRDRLTAARARLDYLTAYRNTRFEETSLTRWAGADMAALNPAAATYTTEIVGVREPACNSRGDWYWIMFLTPPATYADGEPVFVEEGELSVRMLLGNSDGSYTGDTFFELIDTHRTDGALSHFITAQEYEEAPEYTDPDFGFTCKAVEVSLGVMDKTYTELQFHSGANTTGGRHTVEMYGLTVMVDGQPVWVFDGEALAASQKGNVVREDILNETGKVTGLYAPAGEAVVLADGLTRSLPAGRYACDFALRTNGVADRPEKVRFSAVAADGTVLAAYDYTAADVQGAVIRETDGYTDTARFYFTVEAGEDDAADAEQEITLKVETTGAAEVWLRSAELIRLTSGSERDAARVNAAIAALEPVTEENYAEQADAIRAAAAALADYVDRYGQETADDLIAGQDVLRQAVEDMEALEAAALLQQQQTDAKALSDAIDAIGEVTRDSLPLIEAAEALRAQFVTAYGEEALAQVENEGKLMLARQAYDALAAQPTFTPGDVNGDEAINASDALLALQHSVKLITLEGDQAAAADVSGDGSINASDALLILQYSVKLIDVFPVETA